MVDGRVLFQNPPDHTRIGAGGAGAGPCALQDRQEPATYPATHVHAFGAPASTAHPPPTPMAVTILSTTPSKRPVTTLSANQGTITERRHVFGSQEVSQEYFYHPTAEHFVADFSRLY